MHVRQWRIAIYFAHTPPSQNAIARIRALDASANELRHCDTSAHSRTESSVISRV